MHKLTKSVAVLITK